MRLLSQNEIFEKFNKSITIENYISTPIFSKGTKKQISNSLPTTKPRKNWEKMFKQMHQNNDDKLIISEVEDKFKTEWQW